MIHFEDVFDFQHTKHADVFEGLEYPWEVISLIAQYIDYHSDERIIESDISAAAHIGEHVTIGHDVKVGPGVVIEGPAIIEDGAELRKGAYIRENVIVGRGAVVGHNTEIKNSLLFDQVRADHMNYIGDSVLGFRAHLGAGVIITNQKTPASEITVTTLHKTYPTGLTKFGAIIGDYAEVGSNAVIAPGTIIGMNSIIYPTAFIRTLVAKNSIVKVRQTHDVALRREN